MASASAPRESVLRALARALWESTLGLWRSPRYSVPAVLSLALGLGAATAVFAVFSALVLRPLAIPDEERLVRVGFPGASHVMPADMLGLSAPFLRDFQQLTSVFEEVGTERSWSGRLEVGGRSRRTATQLVSTSFFDTLRIAAVEGRFFTARGAAADGLDVMVVREGYWRNELGGQPIVGQTVRYEGRPMTVLGILRDEQAIPSYMDIWMPENQATQMQRMNFMARGIARLAAGVSVDAARARLADLTRDAGVRAPDGSPVMVQVTPLRDSLVQPERAWITLMMAAVVAFLLLAAANLAALFATRAAARSHEWSVRRALGASGWRLARRGALDAGLVGALGASLGLVLARAAIELTNGQYQSLGNTPARLDARVLGAFALATLLCALVGALAPMLSLRRVLPADALRGEGRSTDSPRARRWREALLVLQVAVTTLLLLDAGLLVRSVRSLLALDPGFRTEDVVTAHVLLPLENVGPPPETPGAAPASPELRTQWFEARRAHMVKSAQAAIERMRRISGVVSASASIDVPFDWHNWPGRIELPPGAPQRELMSIVHFVGASYFETLGMPLLSGTTLDAAPIGDGAPIRAVVSRSFAGALGMSDAVGQRFRWVPPGAPPSDEWAQIIGMVEDSIENDLTGPPPIHVYLPHALGALSVSSPTSGGFILAVRGEDPERILRELPAALNDVLPGTAAQPVQRMRDWVDESFWQRTALSRVLSALALAAMVLSAIGLFGVTSFTTTQRVGELAIRRALGATRGAVIGLVLREMARVVGIGIAIGAALSWLSHRLLASFLFGIAAVDPLTIAGVAAGILLVSALAALTPALSASRINPARALV